MRIAIIGNRVGWTYERVRQVLKEYNVYKSDTIISGGALGVDTFAQQYAKEIGAKLTIVYPDPAKPSPKRYFDRNQEIVMSADLVIAFNKDKNPKCGTANTINNARRIKVKVIVIDK